MADNGNGKKDFPGVVLNLRELQRQDGIIAEAIDRNHARSGGVIQTYINAVLDNKDLRQILKHAYWRSFDEADRAVRAIAACESTGATRTLNMILHQIVSHQAGERGYLMHEAFEALTHTTFTTNSAEERKKHNDYQRDAARLGHTSSL